MFTAPPSTSTYHAAIHPLSPAQKIYIFLSRAYNFVQSTIL